MLYLIKLDGQEIARISGERIQFGRKMASASLMEREMVDDRNVLKQLDEQGNVLWVLWLSHKGNLTVEGAAHV